MAETEVLILGDGYTAQWLEKELQCLPESPSIVVTSRTRSSRLQFNLSEEQTWKNLPQADVVFWTFPPEPFEKVRDFYQFCSPRWERLVVMASTSALQVKKSEARVTEDTALDTDVERVKSEVFLRDQGAILLLSAGIYGPGRSPLDWVRKGYVGKSEKFVNMVHIKDLCQFLMNASRWGKPGRTYIAANNNPQRWQEVIENWEARGLISATPEKKSGKLSKKVDNSQSIKELKVNLQYRNFADSVS